jgi:hypothetical protein
MTTMAFDSLRYARRLREVGVPEPQAEVQAELMAEAFGFYAENILTRDHFTDVINARFAEQDAKIEKRFAAQDAKFEQRFTGQDAKIEALEAKMDKRFSEQDAKMEALDAKFDKRFNEQALNFERRFSSIDQRFTAQDGKLNLHTWMLGLLIVVLVIPQLQAWLT